MVHSVKIIGAVLSFIIGGSSALTQSTVSQNTKISTSTWGISSNFVTHEVRRAPPTASVSTCDPFVMMPSTLERPTVNPGAAGPAVLDRPEVQKRLNKEPVKEKKRTGSEAWEVRIYNDGKNTREFVARPFSFISKHQIVELNEFVNLITFVCLLH